MNRRIKNTSGSTSRLHSDLAIPPGEYLAETMVELGLDRAELAQKAELSEAVVVRILNGTEPITRAIAAQLESTTGVLADIWLGLETEYRLASSRVAMDERQEDEIGRRISL